MSIIIIITIVNIIIIISILDIISILLILLILKGVQTYHGYTLSNWFSCGQSADIESAIFSSESNQVKFSCKVRFFYYG